MTVYLPLLKIIPMNRLILILATLVILATGCVDNAKNPTPISTGEKTMQDTARYQPLYIHTMLGEEELNAQTTSQGGYGQIMDPPMNRSEPRMLTRDYWVVEFYHDSFASKEQRKKGQGQWFQFNPDGSFIGGHWEKQTHSGLWYIIYDGDKKYITIDSNVDRLDAKWDMQAIGGEEDAMGWVRSTEFGPRTPKSVTIKLITLSDVPTKKQFGVAEDTNG